MVSYFHVSAFFTYPFIRLYMYMYIYIYVYFVIFLYVNLHYSGIICTVQHQYRYCQLSADTHTRGVPHTVLDEQLSPRGEIKHHEEVELNANRHLDRWFPKR